LPTLPCLLDEANRKTDIRSCPLWATDFRFSESNRCFASIETAEKFHETPKEKIITPIHSDPNGVSPERKQEAKKSCSESIELIKKPYLCNRIFFVVIDNRNKRSRIGREIK